VYAFDNRGDIWRMRGNYDRALAEYNQALSIDPDFLSSLLNRGQTYQKMGNLRAAQDAYQTVLDRPGTDAPIEKWAKGEARRLLSEMGPSAQQ
jgi:tetratricopeptide (TPR) repeat protein